MIDVEEIRSWLRTRYPEFKNEAIHVNTIGHQNLILIMGAHVFRFPRSDEDIRNMKWEQKVLPKLQKWVNLPIPNFTDSSKKEDPYPFVCYPMIQGTPLSRSSYQLFKDADKKRFAKDIGVFLSRVHTFPISQVTSWNADEVRARWKNRWKNYLRTIHRTVSPHVDPIQMEWICDVFDGYLNSPKLSEFQPSLIHGDFKPGHIIFDYKSNRVAGIIDFGQLQIADPAFDFENLYLRFGEEFVIEALKHYNAPMNKKFFDRIKLFYAQVMPFNAYIGAIERNDARKIKDMKHWLEQMAK